jgi:arsenate reductase
MSGTLYHNPQCSKSRQTLALLTERGLQLRVIEYLKTPPTEAQLRTLLKQLNLSAHQLIRATETLYKELSLSKNSTEDELIAAMTAHPKLIERPIFVYKEHAVIGRPPENVLALL